MRLDKLLVELQYGSRKEMKQAAKRKEIRVDGVVCKDTSIHVDPSTQEIEFQGEIISYKKFMYVMMNKPSGVVSAVSDHIHMTVSDLLFPEIRQELFPVGRLDLDTTGLILLTNDGDFAHRVAHSKQGVTKTYHAVIDHKLSDEDVHNLSTNIILDGVRCLPAVVEVLEDTSILLTIQEGKYHQVKRMLEAVDNKVIALKRIRIGHLELDETLQEGEFREMRDEDFDELGVPIC